jgi:4-hydroxybenzoate polyprenyltransferase
MGLVFSIGKPTIHKLATGALCGIANFFLLANIWTFNDWADIDCDRLNGTKHLRLFTRKGIAPSGMLWFAMALLCTSMILFALLGPRTLLIAACIAALGFLYSVPGFRAKSIVVLSSVAHLVGGALHFLLGYSLFGAIDLNAMLAALFFGLIFTAGHLVQEIQDHDADRLAGIRTNAVVFGELPVFCAAMALFMFAYGYLLYLASAAIVPVRLGPLALALCAVHLHSAGHTLRTGLSFDSVQVFRHRYRAFFAVIGFVVISTLFS